ncbi:MAG TPA: substrate-binding domain-containing protein, partial [Cytophagaceae bacterium]
MKNPIILKFTFLILGIAIWSCGNNGGENKSNDPNRLEGNITLSGAFALYPLANIWAEEFTKLHPDVRFNISAGGAGKGMSDALSGAAHLGMFSREIKEEEKQKGAWHVAVCKDAVLPTVNPSNPLIDVLMEKGLSQDEFRKIFLTNEITTWGEATGVDSNNDKIKVFTRSDAAGAADVWSAYM